MVFIKKTNGKRTLRIYFPDNALLRNYLVGESYARHILMNNNLYMPHVTGEKHAVQMK